ncbi:hypothetical protein BN903_9 [Halorubrum sp. AJ67]|nr:hypothetical protein BN903_9 [Halorubrum sp. AJ67]
MRGPRAATEARTRDAETRFPEPESLDSCQAFSRSRRCSNSELFTSR